MSSSGSRLVFTVWCSAALLAAFVLAKDSSESSEENHSVEKHGPECVKHNHHHDLSNGSHRHHHHHHHPRFHHSRHHHHHHDHHGSKENITTTSSTTLSPLEGNDLDSQVGNADIGAIFGTITSTTSLPTDLGIVNHQPDDGGIDLRASKSVVEQIGDSDNSTANGGQTDMSIYPDTLGDHIQTTSEITNELTHESTNAPTAANE